MTELEAHLLKRLSELSQQQEAQSAASSELVNQLSVRMQQLSTRVELLSGQVERLSEQVEAER